MSGKPIVCADAIVRYGDGIIVIERLGSVLGLALPGGKQDVGETLSETIIREVQEETGLRLVIESVLGTYADPGRDPRGNYISTVFVGIACGVIRDEEAKTRVLILTEQHIRAMKNHFVFDHSRMLEEYILSR